MGVRHGKNHDQQAEQIRMIVPRALVRHKHVPVRNRVHGAAGSVVETGEHAQHAWRRSMLTCYLSTRGNDRGWAYQRVKLVLIDLPNALHFFSKLTFNLINYYFSNFTRLFQINFIRRLYLTQDKFCSKGNAKCPNAVSLFSVGNNFYRRPFLKKSRGTCI